MTTRAPYWELALISGTSRLQLRSLALTAVVSAALWLGAAPAQARPHARGDSACTTAHRSARDFERAGHLRQARDLYLTCARPTCGAFVQRDCATRYTELGADIPSVVPLVTDESGSPQVDVRVTVDGELLTSRLDGHALSVDPGLHEFSFSAGDGASETQKLMIAQGQRNRAIQVSLRAGAGRAAGLTPAVSTASRPVSAAPSPAPVEAPAKSSAAPPAAETRLALNDAAAAAATDDEEAGGATPRLARAADVPGRRMTTAAYALGGVALAGLAGYGVFTYWGRKDNDMLGQCAPACEPSSVQHVRRMYLGADVSLGVGVAALVAASYVYLRSAPDVERAGTRTALRLGVSPAPSGATAALSGAF